MPGWVNIGGGNGYVNVGNYDFFVNPKKTTLVVIGDSWVSAEFAADGVSTHSRGIAVNTNLHLKNYFQIEHIKGVGGERLDEIQARFATDVLANSPGFCMIIGGLNDLSADRTGAQMYASTKLMIDAAISAGVTPIVVACNVGTAAWINGITSQAQLEARIEAWSEYHRLLMNYQYSNSGWIYASSAMNNIIDHEYNDPTYGVNCPNLLGTCAISQNGVVIDTSHPGSAGAFRIGKSIATQLSAILPAADNLPHHYNDKTAAAWNCMQKITGTPSAPVTLTDTDITGNAPEGWMARVHVGNGLGAATLSQPGRTDIVGGFWSKGVSTNVAKGQYLEYRESETTEFNYLYHELADYDLAVGDTVIFTAELKIHTVGGADQLSKFSCSIYVANSSNGLVEIVELNKNGGGDQETYIGADFEDTPLVISSFPYTFPANSAKWYVYARCQVSGGSHVVSTTDFTFELGRVGIRKIA